MILCTNPNAAIDKTVIVSPFQLGKIHRPEAVKALPGGKGCNVARALKTLGDSPVVTGWVGGSAGQFIEKGLHAEGIRTSFVWTDFESRTCLSILDDTNQLVTEIYEKGDPIPPQQVDAMRDHFRAIIGQYKAVTFSGSLPPGVPIDFYADLIRIAHDANVLTFLDSSNRTALEHGLEAKPFLIKPNEDEVTALMGRSLTSTSDYAQAAVSLSQRYGSIVVISLGAQGAIVARDTEILHVQNPPVDAKSAVGSGDCMLAGLACGFTHDFPFEDALKYGMAAGAANTLMVGAGTFTLEAFERIRTEITLYYI
jgi:tagatose 6-phosphate kinase